MKPRRRKLNEYLDPNEFTICVPEDCDCILDDYRHVHRPGCQASSQSNDGRCTCAWNAYLADLDAPITLRPLDSCCPREQSPPMGYELRGEHAIEHARRVLLRIYRYVLRFENVTAVDVGFAVLESQETFLNALAIRIHVGTKQPVSVLKRKGFPANLVWRFWAPELSLSPPAKRHATLNPWIYSGILQSLSVVRIPPGATPVGTPGLKYLRPPDQLNPAPSLEPAVEDESPTVLVPPQTNSHCDPCHESCPSCRQCCCCSCCCGCEEPDCEGYRLAICGVPLDIIEANYFPAGVHPGGDFRDGVFVGKMEDTRKLSDQENLLIGRGRVSPLVGGISIGSDNGLAGTLGAIVWDETDGNPCVLGNWHVLAGRGAKTGQPCYQPSIFDGGDDGDVIGHLKRWHFGELGDAALAELDGSRYFASGEILGLWHPISGYRPPELNLTVRKWGRTTGFSEGFIDGIHLATALKYDNETIRHFERQFHIAPLYRGDKVSQVGDSGSIVVSTVDLNKLEEKCEERLQGQAKELEELRLVARTLLRKRPTKLVVALRKLVGGGAKDLADLIGKVRDLLRTFAEEPSPARQDGDERSDFEKALAACRGKPEEKALLANFKELLGCVLEEYGINVEKFLSTKVAKEYRDVQRVYFAVGMIFAGDTPGSPFGEFALASDIGLLAEDMRFSLRPVFEPRSSFRKLRSRPPRRGRGDAGPRGRSFEPGDQEADPRGGGPQPDGASYQSGGGDTGGG